MSRASVPLAGFQVTLIGRFWVTPEEVIPGVEKHNDKTSFGMIHATRSSRSTFSTLYRRVKEHVVGQYGRGQGLYKYQNQTLIEQLAITPEEERHMKTLISTSEKYRRNNDRRREARGYQSKRVERAKKIVELHRAGLSLRQIAVVVGCGKSTVMDELKSPLITGIDSLT